MKYRIRAGITSSIAVTVLAIGGVCAAAVVGTPTITRYQGPDRYATSAAVVDANFSPGVPVVYVATGTNFPDALAGGAAAARDGGPLLLVRPNAIPAAVGAELQRLQPARIVVLGGTGAVDVTVMTALQPYTSGAVTRVSGSDRYETAAALATGFPIGSPVYVVTGANFPDALAATAAAAARHAAILLTDPNNLPIAAAQALTRLAPSAITIVGGTSAVSSGVASTLSHYSSTVTRVWGTDRYATAAQVAAVAFSASSGAFVASGVGFADALTGGPVAGMHDEPLLLSAPTCLPKSVAVEVSALNLSSATLLGGIAALGQGVATLTTCTAAVPTAATPCGAASSGNQYAHVVWIWLENKPYSSVIGSPSAPYENSLARSCGLATNYDGVAHPSLPNYLAATGGSTFGVADDANPAAHPIAAASIFSELQAAGKSWRSYEESMPGNCDLGPAAPYAVKHNPAAYYTGIRSTCAVDDLPLNGHFDQDINAGALPSFSFVTPNLCNDMHDCSVATGDQWLSTWVPKLLNGPNYRAGNTLVVLTWDEGTTASNQVPTIVVAPSVRPGTVVGAALNHYALLRATEDLLGLGRLGAASTAPSLAVAFGL